MTTEQSQPRPRKVDIAVDLVARAWEDACRASGRTVVRPIAIVPLKAQRPDRKSGAYRLEGAGEAGSPVVAKRSRIGMWTVEREAYERILPRIGVPALRYYGSLRDPDGRHGWLFIEDAGSTKLAQTDRAVAAEWLARLHEGAATRAHEISLPDRGPAHYLNHLRVGRQLIGIALTQLDLPTEDRDALRVIQKLGERLEARWDAVRGACAVAPTTLVHGDFVRKNTRVRNSSNGKQVLVLDWETAGIGPPAADIPYIPTCCRRNPPSHSPGKPLSWDGTVPLDVYAAHSGGHWGGGRLRELEAVAHAGTIFRIVAAIRWAAEQRDGETFGGTNKLRYYSELLPVAMAHLGC